MKPNRDSLLFISLIFVVPFLLAFSKVLSKEDSENRNLSKKEIRHLFSKMKYMEGGTFTMGRTSFSPKVRMTVSDSTLFTGSIPKRTVVDPYYISTTEVTNGDWREFYQAKVLELS